MPISPEQFKQILAKSSKLCSPEVQSSMKSPNNINEGYYSSPEDLEAMTPFGGSYEPSENYTKAPMVNKVIAENSKLPDAIKQSMLSEQIDVSSMDPNLGQLNEIMKDIPARKPSPAFSQPRSNSGGNIDYSIIKAIVEECIDRKLNEFKQQSLNETTLKTIGLSKGNIKLIDNRGNVFEAQLKHKGNINE